MAQDSNGKAFYDKLKSRGGSLHRRSMADGGEVYTGALAQEALDAVGARAMTMDSAIIMGDTDTSKAENLALYAHERHHQAESGGAHNGDADDHEEREARSIEKMVLHKSRSGESESKILDGLQQRGAPESAAPTSGGAKGGAGGGGTSGATSSGGAGGASGDSGSAKDEDPMGAYRALLGQGKKHHEIVRELTDYVVAQVIEGKKDTVYRTSDSDYRGV